MKDKNIATLALKLSEKHNNKDLENLPNYFTQAQQLVRRYEGGTENRYKKYSEAVKRTFSAEEFENNMYKVLHRWVDIYGGQQ